MNCENSTAPIDINNNPTGTCDLKCKFNYKYKESGSKLTNNTFYLSLTHDQVYPAPVNFNADDYQVSEIRIYSPSLHTYSGVHAEAEMIIVHTGTQGTLLVCLPIIKGNKTTTKSEKDLETIIKTAKKFARKPNEETALQQNFNLNNFIPKNKPFFSYKATLPYIPCNGEHNYVVFSKDDGAYITIYEDLLKDLKTDDNNTLKSDDLDLVNFIFKKDKVNTVSSTEMSNTSSILGNTTKEYFITSTSVIKRMLQSSGSATSMSCSSQPSITLHSPESNK